MGTVADVLRIAKGELGKSDGSKYFAYFGYPDLGPYCVAGARWAYAQAGVDCHWSTFYAFDYSDAPSQYVVDPYDLEPGDFVSFDWDDDYLGDHVGIVESVHDWGISTVEFNTDWGVVAEKQRVWACVICGIRPTFETKPKWIRSGDRWWYRHADGSYTTDGWEQIDGEWYCFDSEGWMRTGWVKWGDEWYYLSELHDGLYGHMVHSGIFADSKGDCYAFRWDGCMVTEGDIVATPNSKHDGTYGKLITTL